MKAKLTLLFLIIFISSGSIYAQGNWKVYTDELDVGSLRSGNYTKHFSEDQDGNIWISVSNGCILKFKDEAWEVFEVEKISFMFGQSAAAAALNLKKGITADWEIAPDANGRWMWFGSGRGVVLWDGSKMLEITGNLDNENRMIFYSEETKESFVVRNNEIIKIENPDKNKSGDPIIQINKLFIDSKGSLWIGSLTGDIFCLADGVWKSYDFMKEAEIKKEVKRSPRAIRQIFEDKEGIIWILGNSFIATCKDSEMSVLKPLNYPRAIFQDTKNNIWVSYEDGIMKYDGTDWQEYEKKEDNVPGESKFLEDSKGNLWYSSKTVFATRKGGCLYKFDGTEWEQIKIEKYHTDIYEDSRGNIWGSGMRGLYLLNNGNWELKREAVGFAVFFNEIFEDAKANIWIGTSTVSGRIERLIPE